MVPPVEPMTYDDVTEIYRKEQRLKAITEVRRDFYPALRECLDRLRRDNEREIASDPFSPKSMSLSNQLKKISEKADQIFEFRMEKLLQMALRASGGGKADTSRLTVEEKEIYDQVLALIQQRRALGLGAKKEEVKEAAEPEEPSLPQPIPMVATEEIYDGPAEAPGEAPALQMSAPQEPISQAQNADPAPKVQAKSVPLPSQGEYVLLRILEDIPPFAGPDRTYVLCREDLITLPTSIAKALITRKKAVGIQTPSLRFR